MDSGRRCDKELLLPCAAQTYFLPMWLMRVAEFGVMRVGIVITGRSPKGKEVYFDLKDKDNDANTYEIILRDQISLQNPF